MGEVLDGKYQIVREIGRGAMGVVYEAIQVALHRRVAVKTLLEPDAQGQRGARFELEAHAASAIGHPNIIEVFDLGHTREGMLYMVMQLLDGAPLAARLAQTPMLPIPVAQHIMSQVLSGLAAAHRNGIVHRDLKPDNIFILSSVEQPDFVKLVDFGISKMMGRESARPGSRVAKTIAGSVLGTPLYMSPEQALGQIDAIDHRTDIYSAGVVFYEMLCGRPPFEGEGLAQVIASILDGNPPEPRALRPEIPPDLEAVIMRALSRDPRKRFESAAAMRAEITGRAEITPPPVAVGAPPDPRPRAADTFSAGAEPELDFVALERRSAPQEGDPRARAHPFVLPTSSGLSLARENDSSRAPDLPELAAPKRNPPPRARLPSTSLAAPIRRPRAFPWLLVAAGAALVVVAASLALYARRQQASPRTAPLEKVQRFRLRVSPESASVKLDHVPVSARELPLDSGPPRAHLLHVAAPGHVTRTFAFTATAGMELEVRLGRTLPVPSPADPPPLPAELEATYPEAPRPYSDIDQVFGWLDRYLACLSATVAMNAAAQTASRDELARGEGFAPCRELLDMHASAELSALHAAAMAYVSAAASGEKASALARLGTRFRAAFLASRTTWQMEELARVAETEGHSTAWHMRRVALAAQAWVRARRVGGGPSDARARQLDAYTQELASHVRDAKQPLGVVRGTDDFLRAAEEMAALARPPAGRRASDTAAHDACRKLLTEFDALVLE